MLCSSGNLCAFPSGSAAWAVAHLHLFAGVYPTKSTESCVFLDYANCGNGLNGKQWDVVLAVVDAAVPTVIRLYQSTFLWMGWFSGDRGGITLSLYYTTIACYSTNNSKLKFNVKRLVGPPSYLAEALCFVKHSVWFHDVYFSPSQRVCSQSEGGVWWVPLATLKSRLASKKWSA